VQNLGAKIYLVTAILVVALLSWQVVNTKLIYHSPKYKSVLLLPVPESPVWEASNSATLAASEATLSDQVTAQAYLVLDLDSKTILVEKNANLPLPPASTTKLMTALTSLELFDLNDVVEVSTEAAKENNGGGLFPRERLTVRSLLTGLLVSSANDAAIALAESAPGGEEGFINKMNELARRLHLEQTFYSNPAGYDDPPNLTTARDLSTLSQQALAYPLILERLSSPTGVVFNLEGNIRHFLYSTNEMLDKSPEIIAGKTGTTELAGEVLMSLAKVNNHLVLLVVMGSHDRYTDTQVLLNWVRSNIAWPSTAQ
jgi:D-alanyl-D-alanine carboxypeptidase